MSKTIIRASTEIPKTLENAAKSVIRKQIFIAQVEGAGEVTVHDTAVGAFDELMFHPPEFGGGMIRVLSVDLIIRDDSVGIEAVDNVDPKK